MLARDITETKHCTKCRQNKPLSTFSKDNARPDGLFPWCKKCSSEHRKALYYANWEKETARHRKYYRENREKKKESHRAWLARNSERVRKYRREYNRARHYWLALDGYLALQKSQKSLCAICSLPQTRRQNGCGTLLAVDHSHVTGKIRGLLCHKCNALLGMAQDKIPVLESAIEYLKKNA